MSSSVARLRAAFEPLMRHAATAWVVLLLLLLLTVAAWAILNKAVSERVHDRFVYETIEIHRAISERLGKQARVLAGGAGLFAASKSVERDEWRAYVLTLDLERNYPGLQGLGYSQVIRPPELATHLRTVRAEGFPQYTIRPDGVRDVYTSIVFLEPFTGRNLRAFGYDMLSEPVRRAAMERARDTGEVALSGKVTLVQETDQNVQAGFLMYRPVYRNGAPVQTLEQRRAAHLGYVYSPFRMNDLMGGVIQTDNNRIDYHIYDDNRQDPEHLMHSSMDPGLRQNASTDLQRTVGLTFGGRDWLIRFQAGADYVSVSDRSLPYMVATGGLLIDVLVFMVLSSFAGQRRRAEALAERMTAAVRSGAAREHAIVTHVADGIVTLDVKGIVESCNGSACRMFGYPEAEMLGQSGLRLLKDDQRVRLAGWLKESETAPSTTAGQGTTLITEGRRRDGGCFPMELSMTQAELDQRRLVVMIVRDITERQRIDRMKDEFVSTVSHELRTPLTSIRGALGLVGSGQLGALPPQVNQLVTIASRNSERLLHLINDILDIEQLTSDKMHFDLSPSDLALLLEQALEMNRDYASEYKVHYRLGEIVPQAMAQVDEHRFQQVMANLLSNAAKFSSANSEVQVTLTDAGNFWRIAVQDTGSGIPEEFRDRVFSQFSQADATDTRKRGGTGLGLHISKKIVERMGGRMGFESQVGTGTTFWFELPVEIKQVQTASMAASRS